MFAVWVDEHERNDTEGAMRENSEPKTMLQSYWERGELYMKNPLAYEATQVFHYYARKVHDDFFDEQKHRAVTNLALSASNGFHEDGVLAEHVRVPFAKDQQMVALAVELLTEKLELYDDTEAGIPYRIEMYRDELLRQHKKVSIGE